MAIPFTATNLIEVAAQAVEACLPWYNEPIHPTGPLQITASMCVGPELVGEGSRQVQVRLKVPTAMRRSVGCVKKPRRKPAGL